jgi:hypothetical protein
MLRLLDQDAFGVAQERALEEQQRTVFLEAMYQNNIASLVTVTGTTPFQVFIQLAFEDDLPELLKFFLPFFFLVYNGIYLRMHTVDLLVNGSNP